MNQQRLHYLVGQFMNNQLTVEEQQEFHVLLNDAEQYPNVLAAFETLGGEVYASEEADETLLPLLQRAPLADKPEMTGQAPVRRLPFLRKWGWAAAILVMLSAGAYIWRSYLSLVDQDSPLSQVGTDVAPGRDGAILTLADGRKIILDSLGNGTIANQNGTAVVLNNGQLKYEAAAGKGYAEQQWNTMYTPKGRQFNVTLPDGTRVWLNAASSITFPTAFTGNERRIQLTGEAYFEVTKDKTKPFFVKINDQAEVEVLGTSFNVNGYGDEPNISTTLLEGSVKVKSEVRGQKSDANAPASDHLSLTSAVLKPGQQAQIVNDAVTTLTLKQADIDKVMAWRYGAFDFEDASLQEVMRQLARWYDIEVVYEKGIPDIRFVGEMSRDMTLAGVLKALDATNVHFRIVENRRLVVEP
ncbi:MAG: FecR domain-containing protein [Niastella sp.]|nr:FecR domain-containing protein [Niastella sp.]